MQATLTLSMPIKKNGYQCISKYDVREDPGKIKIQNWSIVAMDEEAWNRIAEQAKTHKVVQRQEKK